MLVLRDMYLCSKVATALWAEFGQGRNKERRQVPSFFCFAARLHSFFEWKGLKNEFMIESYLAHQGEQIS